MKIFIAVILLLCICAVVSADEIRVIKIHHSDAAMIARLFGGTVIISTGIGGSGQRGYGGRQNQRGGQQGYSGRSRGGGQRGYSNGGRRYSRQQLTLHISF